MLFGTRLHLLLEHLPGRDPDDWPAIARDVLADAEGGLPDPDSLNALLLEAREVLHATELAQVFDLPAGAEVLRLVRVGIGALALGDLQKGAVRPLQPAEIELPLCVNTGLPGPPPRPGRAPGRSVTSVAPRR